LFIFHARHFQDQISEQFKVIDMADLVVFAFDNEIGAQETRDALIRMQTEQLIELEDAAVVIRPLEGKPKV